MLDKISHFFFKSKKTEIKIGRRDKCIILNLVIILLNSKGKRKSEFNLISPIVRETGHIDTKMNLKKYYLKKSKGKKE